MMWNPRTDGAAWGSYESVRTSDDLSDDETLADENDLAHASGRDKDHGPTSAAANDSHTDYEVSTSPRWADDTARLGRWRLRSNPPGMLDLTDKSDDGAVGLANDESNVALVRGAAMSPRRAAAGEQTISWLVWPLPSFTHRFFGVRYPEEPRRPTDYLDGLRGVASLCVFCSHYLLRIHPHIVHEGYGHGDINYSPLQLPFIRLFHSGGAMVAIFFIISGYVLSQRCILAMRSGDQNKLWTALTSMTFRRAIRLFLPSIAISLVTLSMVLLGFIAPEYPQNWSWGWELENYQFHLFDDLFRLWDWEISFEFWYAPQLWTIPAEYRCSMVLFLFILMVARTTVFIRLTMGTLTIMYLFYMDRWDIALFLFGMWIAEINIIFKERKERKERDGTIIGESEKPTHLRSIRRRCLHMQKSTILLSVMIFVGMVLGGYPDVWGLATPVYDWLPEYGGFWAGDFTNYRFWVAIGSIMIILPITFLPRAQALFTTPLARYLGKISYALYLVHELMAITVRVTVMNLFWGFVGYDSEEDEIGDFRYELGWALALIAYVPLVIWAADIFWRAVDIPTVKFAKWFESKCFVKRQS
jgi:peptidoglycan/LPS O-acetylase OafA/YrhL